MALCAGILAGVMPLHATPSYATKPTIRATVTGCALGGRFVPYAKHRNIPAQKLPQWVRVSGGKKAEGQEIRLSWTGCPGCGLPNFAGPKNSASWEITGACNRGELAADPPAAVSR